MNDSKSSDFCTKVVRRLWLNQILEWALRGKVSGKEYSREDIIALVESDVEAKGNISEYQDVMNLLKDGTSKSEIRTYIRKALTGGDDE